MERWCWEGGVPDACPRRALRSARGLEVGHSSGWRLEASTVVEGWGRWCAQEVVALWAAPSQVTRWLEVGGEAPGVEAIAEAAARQAARQAARADPGAWADRKGPRVVEWAARATEWAAAGRALEAASAAVLARSEDKEQVLAAQSARLGLMLHAEHQLQALEARFRDLWVLGEAERAVLRDLALARGMHQLAVLLAPDPVG